MNGILNKLRSARYILTIDQAYFQILLAKDSREITAFNVLDKELYYFTNTVWVNESAHDFSTTFR